MKSQHLLFVLSIILLTITNVEAQKFKVPKLKKKDKKEAAPVGECSEGQLTFTEKALMKKRQTSEFTLRKIAGAMTKEAEDLTSAAVTIMYIDNLIPRKYFNSASKTDEWQWCGGSDAISVQLSNREGAGLVKLSSGDISYNNTTFEYGGVGNYFKSLPSSHASPLSIQLGSVKEAIDIAPPKPIQIVSINGQSKGENITINTNEDIELELDFEPTGETDEGVFTLNLVAHIPPTKTKLQYEVAVFKGQKKVIIPKEVFMNYSGSGGKLFKNNCLTITRNFEKVKKVAGIGAVRTLVVAQDWTPITVEDRTEKDLGMYSKSVELNYEKEQDGVKTSFMKPNAFYGQPFKSGQKVAIASVVVKGSTTTKSVSDNWIIEHQLTLPDAALAKIAEEAYLQLKKELQASWDGVEIMELGEVVKFDEYQNIKDFNTPNSKDYTTTTYKGSKNMIPTTIEELTKSASISFPSDQPMVRLKRALDVDAVVAMTIDFHTTTAGEGQDVTVIPRLSLKAIGDTRSPQFGPTVFIQGTSIGKAVSYEDALKKVNGGVEQLNLILQKDKMIPEIGHAIQDFKGKEGDYSKIWKLVE